MDDASLINPDDWVDQYGDALNTEEICKVMDITASNCWVMLYRARMLLRRCIEINWTRK